MPGEMFSRRVLFQVRTCLLGIVFLAGAPALAQPVCENATPIAVGAVATGSNTTSTGDGRTGLCVPTSRSAWHSFVPSVSGVHTISLCGSAINSVATLYDSCAPAAAILACDDDSCADDALLTPTLTAGQTYYLRVASSGSSAGGAYSVLISQPPTSPIINDLCGSAFVLPINTPQTYANAPTFASDISACGTSDTSDVWFVLQAGVPGTYVVQVCSQAFQPVLSVVPGCFSLASTSCNIGATPYPCAGGGSAALNITPAAPGNVLLRVSGVRGSFGPFSIVAYAPRANDLCANAEPLTIGTPVAGYTNPILSTETSVNCAASGLDVWYAVVPNVSGQYTISTCTATDFDTVLSIHTACPGTPGAGVIACSDDACSAQASVTLSLAAGTAYRIRVAGKGATAAWGNFTVSAALNAPPNDSCPLATTIPENAVISGSTIGATGSDITPCGTSDAKDVWYAFTPNVSANYEIHTCGSTTAASVALFDACAGTPIACNDADAGFCGPGSAGAKIAAALNAGSTYRIRVAVLNGGEGAFQLAVTRAPVQNDSCANAQTLALGQAVASTLTSATPSGTPSCGPDAADVWFSFTPAITRHYRVHTCGSASPTVLAIYSSCTPGTPIACASAPSGSCVGTTGASAAGVLEAGLTYRIRVSSAGAPAGAFRVVVEPVAPPNDTCDRAATLALGTPTLGSNADATTDALGTCAADGRDVWYALSIPTSGWYRIRTCAGPGTLDSVLTLHASCAAAAYECNNDSAPLCPSATTRSGLVARLAAGSSVLVRVSGAGGQSGSFTIDAALVPPPNDLCASATTVGNGTTTFETAGATTDGPTIAAGCAITPPLSTIQSDIWFRYTAPQSGPTRVSLCGSQFDTVLAVSAGTCPSGPYSVIACSDDAPCIPGSVANTIFSSLTFPASANQTYLIRVGSRNGVEGSGVLSIAQGNLCACDFDRSGTISPQDIFDFLNAWFLQLSTADFNGNSMIDPQDLFDFLNCWFSRPSGC